jgi:endonuclease/exonuclease/phosphatase (EEP) superfamily protein YafD
VSGFPDVSVHRRRGRRERETLEVAWEATGQAAHEAHEAVETAGRPTDPARLPGPVLPTVSAVLLGWALMTLVGDVRWGPLSVLPVGLASMSPLLLVPALVVVTMAARRRSWVSVVLAAAAGVLPWTFVVGYIVPASPPSGRAVPLRALLVTARDGTADAAAIAETARVQGADLVVVTELSSALAHDLTAAGLARRLSPRYVSVPDDAPASAGIVVYSRYPMDKITAVPGTRWPAVRARLTVGRTPMTVVVGHAVQPSIGHLEAWSRDQRAFAAAARIRGPVLVLANLNATPWHPQFRRVVSGRLHDAADVLGQGLWPTWPTWSVIPLLPTDHALVAGLGVTFLGTTTLSGTDHRALTVEVQLPTT